jgi:hypothetical protein
VNILVCDDKKERCDEIISSIREGTQFDPQPLVEDELSKELEKFYAALKPRLNDPATWQPLPELRFDNTDIIVLDNNLALLELKGTRLTAESLIGHIRAFTSATYVISLNKNSDVDFDLKYLIGDYETQADVALNTKHLANPALWTGDQASATDDFIPWYWPRLQFVADRRRAQVNFVLEHLDDPILTALKFPDEAIGFLSRHAIGTLSPRAVLERMQDTDIPIRELTFRDVFTDNERTLPVQEERLRLSESEGGNREIRNIMARDVAARLDLWFRKDVVGPQDALVDVPHLLSRFPFLLGERAKSVDEWNKSVSANTAPYGMEPQLYEQYLQENRYTPEYEFWVPTAPCFWWPKLKAEDKLNEYFFTAKEGDWADVVFCEDRSQFLERVKADDNSPVEFPTEFEGSWTQRYVSPTKDIQYSPRRRLAQ